MKKSAITLCNHAALWGLVVWRRRSPLCGVSSTWLITSFPSEDALLYVTIPTKTSLPAITIFFWPERICYGNVIARWEDSCARTSVADNLSLWASDSQPIAFIAKAYIMALHIGCMRAGI